MPKYDLIFLSQFSPDEIERYLETSGWRLLQDEGGPYMAAYERNGLLIHVPQMPTWSLPPGPKATFLPSFADYARRLAGALEVLSSIEERSRFEIVADLIQNKQ
jgi:hypothetical protein